MDTTELYCESFPTSIGDIPYEIVWLILSFCRTDDWFSMGKTSWWGRNVVTDFMRNAIKTKHYPHLQEKSGKRRIKGLYSEQIKGLVSLKNHPDSNIFLRSPMGSGKTLMAILHAFECWKERGIRTIIVATPKCFTSWLEHLKLTGLKLVKSKPEKSDFLVYHSTAKPHQNFIHQTCYEDLKKSRYFILLTTSRQIERFGTTGARLLGGAFGQVVLDEAHLLKPRHFERFLQFSPRNIFLSADAFHQTMRIVTVHATDEFIDTYDVSLNLECEFEHPVKMHCTLVESPQTGGFDRIVYDVRTITQILNSPDFTGKKVVLFTQWGTNSMRKGIKALTEDVPGYTFVKFYNTSLASREKFKKIDRCVLVTTVHSATEGTNFEMADSAIYTNFATGISIPKAKQCFARIRRRNNTNSVIHNYILYNPRFRVSLIRSRVNMAYALSDLELELVNKTRDEIDHIGREMVKDGICIHDIPDPELLTIFTRNLGNNPLPFKEKDYTYPLMDIIRYMNIG